MLKLAYNSNGFRKFTLKDTMKIVKKLGYESLEVGLHHTHLHPLLHTEDYLQDVAAYAKENQIHICNIHTGAKDTLSNIDFEPSLITTDEAGREKKIDFVFKAIDIAQKLNVENVTITSGFLQPDNDYNTALKNLKNSIRKILDYNNGRVNILIEQEPEQFIGTVGDLLRITEEFGDEIGVTLDIGHVNVDVAGEHELESISKLFKWVKHIHFEDIKDRIHNHLIPGLGDIDFKAIMKHLNDLQYQGYCSVELYTYQDNAEYAAKTSIDYLANIMRGLEPGEK